MVRNLDKEQAGAINTPKTANWARVQFEWVDLSFGCNGLSWTLQVTGSKSEAPEVSPILNPCGSRAMACYLVNR